MSLEQAAWSWTEHLRGGGSTPWAEWVAVGAPGTSAVPPGWRAPGAAQLELLRRLSARRPRDGDPLAFAALADQVLGRSAPGRGMAPAPLAWPGTGRRGAVVGPPATDPADVPDRELLRVAVGTLAEQLVRPARGPGALGGPGRSGSGPQRRAVARTRWRRPWAPTFELAGPPVTVGAVAAALAAHGRVPGGHPRQVLLLAEPLDGALAQVWSARVQSGAAVRWRGFVDRWAGRSELPPALDYPVLARTWADRVGAERVHVLVARSPADVLAVLGVTPRRRPRASTAPDPRPLSADALDVVRRVNAVLAVRLREDEHRAAVRWLCARAAEVDRREPAADPACLAGQPPRLSVPDRHRGWLAERAARVVAELGTGGYQVHGETARLLPDPSPAPAGPRVGDALGLALDLCARMSGTGATAERRDGGG